jgi:hypothetical protein
MTDIRDMPVTPENEKLLEAGRAEAKRLWEDLKIEVNKLDEYGALVCVGDLAVMLLGYGDGRWPGFANELTSNLFGEEEETDERD